MYKEPNIEATSEDNNSVIVFGCGDYAQKILPDILKCYSIECFIDNNAAKHGEKFCGYDIVAPQYLQTINNYKVVIASINYASEIFTQLLGLGVREHDIIVDYVSYKKKVYLYDLLNMQKNEYDIDNRMDIAVKYMAIESYYQKNDYGFSVYSSMQKERLKLNQEEANCQIEKYKELIHSFEVSGYQDDSYLVCDEKMHIMDGAHRLALCLYYHIPFVNVKIVPKSFKCNYDIRWFWKHGFSSSLIHTIHRQYEQLLTQKEYVYAIVWPPAYKVGDEITSILGEFLSVVDIIDIQLKNFSDLANIVRAIYYTDDIEKWKVQKKLEHMQTEVSSIRAIKLELPHPHYRLKASTKNPLSTNIESIKNIIRTRFQDQITDYYYDNIIHIADNFYQSNIIENILHLDTNIASLFVEIKDFNYALLKTDVPYMPTDFPCNYPIHKDMDMICLEADYHNLVNIIYRYATQYAKLNNLQVVVVTDGYRTRIRLLHLDYLVYQFDIATQIEGLGILFTTDAISSRIECRGYYKLRENHEIIVRINELIHHPEKKHHKEFLRGKDFSLDEILQYLPYSKDEILKYIGGTND